MGRPDGSLEASVWLPDDDGRWKLITLPSIAQDCVRKAHDRSPMEIPVREMVLTVPKDKPLTDSTLVLMTGEDEEEITHFFARMTPAPLAGAMESLPSNSGQITITVNKNRSEAKSNVTDKVLK